MSILRRFDPEGRPVFITCVCHDRKPLLASNPTALLGAYRYVRRRGVVVVAWVVLPEHMHALIQPGEVPLSDAVRLFKQKFAGLYRCRHHLTGGRLWQHRFWDHIIRNQRDFENHIDYIHYNPVRHGLVEKPLDWKYSSFRQWFRRGYYDTDWGVIDGMTIEGHYGE